MKKIIIAASMLLASAAAHAAPALNSTHAVVFDETSNRILLEKNANEAVPIASVTKVLTAMVALDAKPDMQERIRVSSADVDLVKHSSSRVAVGTELPREHLMQLALMSSENRAASALSRNYPGGQEAFVVAMNRKATSLGMTTTRLSDPTGLSPLNKASANDLVRMVQAAETYQPITAFTTSTGRTVNFGRRAMAYRNTNSLVGKPNWDIGLSKTGYISEAGRCIVMKMQAAGKDLVVVLLGSKSSGARLADIQAIKRWVSGQSYQVAARANKRHPAARITAAKLVKKSKQGTVRLAKREPKQGLARLAKYEPKKQKGKTRRA